MKIAVLFAGRVKGFEHCVESQRSAIFKDHDVDVFLAHNAANTSDDLDLFHQLYPVKGSVDLQIDVSEYERYIYHPPHSCAIMFSYIQKAFELIPDPSVYDIVLYMRADQFEFSDLTFEVPDDSCIYVPNRNDFEYLNDQFAYGSPDSMKQYCSTIQHVHTLAQEGVKYAGESILKAHIDQSNLEVKRFELYYELSPHRFDTTHRSNTVNEVSADSISSMQSTDPLRQYATMQTGVYDRDASNWSVGNRDPVVGTFDGHNQWKDYDDYLFKNVPDLGSKRVLDFGCGPGRNVVKYHSWFKRCDGVDISAINLAKAREWMSFNSISPDSVTLYKCNGLDLSDVPSSAYDIVMSTITLQHICVHEIRIGYFKEFFRVLESGGFLTFQMGFGPRIPGRHTVGYYENYYQASSTNGGCDTRVESPDDLRKDLELAGFTNVSYDIRPVGPGDNHPSWIFIRCQKP